MIDNQWKALLGWEEEEIEELRLSGYSFLKQGHYKKAILFFEALVILNPLSIYDLQTLGALYLQINENAKAIEILDKALRLVPNHLPSLINKVKALFCLHKFSEAFPLAQKLTQCFNKNIANEAEALILSYKKAYLSVVN